MHVVATRRLPVILPSVTDELLSSWIGRHASFYEVSPLIMLRHCIPEIRSLRSADLHLEHFPITLNRNRIHICRKI